MNERKPDTRRKRREAKGNRKPACAAALLAVCCAATHAMTLDDALNESQHMEGVFVVPSAEDVAVAEALFGRLLAGEAWDGELREAWAGLHCILTPIEGLNGEYVMIREEAEHRTGRGCYLVARDGVSPWLLEMPHSFRDLYTGAIGQRLVCEGRFAAAAWNSVPRDLDAHSDLTDSEQNYFTAFTRAFARRYKQGYVVQLHGFAQSKRSTAHGGSADIILSSGTKQPRGYIRELETCLEGKLAETVRLYGVDTSELGGTQNVQGRMLRAMGHGGFIHIELNKEVRQRLRDEAGARKILLDCLQEHLK